MFHSSCIILRIPGLEINSFESSKYLLPGIKGSGKTNIPSSKYWFPCNSPVATLCQIYDQTQFHMVKGIDNAFEHKALCFVLSAEE